MNSAPNLWTIRTEQNRADRWTWAFYRGEKLRESSGSDYETEKDALEVAHFYFQEFSALG